MNWWSSTFSGTVLNTCSKKIEMFQENTGGRGFQIFRKFCLIKIKRIRKHINSILLKLVDIWYFILPE